MQVVPTDQILELFAQGRGSVPANRLCAALREDEIQRGIREGIFQPRDGSFDLSEPFVFFDSLIIALWSVPGGSIGALSALVYHQLSSALPAQIDIVVDTPPERAVPLEIHLIQLEPRLARYGVVPVSPSVPGFVAIPMASPAAALVQVVSLQDIDPLTLEEAIWSYAQRYGWDAAIQQAATHFLACGALESQSCRCARVSPCSSGECAPPNRRPAGQTRALRHLLNRGL